MSDVSATSKALSGAALVTIPRELRDQIYFELFSKTYTVLPIDHCDRMAYWAFISMYSGTWLVAQWSIHLPSTQC